MHIDQHVILHLLAKFRSNRTIVGGVMTSYRFLKMAAIESEMYFRDWTASMLEFYFRFRCRPTHGHRHTILHLFAKFRRNRTIAGGVMTHIGFSRWRQ